MLDACFMTKKRAHLYVDWIARENPSWMVAPDEEGFIHRIYT